ncbi:MAG TPA: UpxY family transcription antiterminator [Flavipsychrobacter sp.]|nr:UpxY family transcription antiterminator [Flavipsychrobacter sp.]
MSVSTSPSWYVIYTKPRHEKKVAEHLGYLNLQCFLPTMRTLKMWSTRKKYMITPLFPSYLFVKLDNTQQYFESLQIPGVMYYVKTGNKIAEVSERLIHKIRTILAGDAESVEVIGERILPGSVQNIRSGPFAGHDCEIVEHKGKHKMLVRIELLQRSIMVDLPIESLAETPSFN